MAGDEQAPIDTSACVPAHELEDHDRSEIDILRDNLRGPEAESVPVTSPGPSEGELAGDEFRGFSMATISSTPLNEWQEGQHLFAIALPTLFPRGVGDLQPPFPLWIGRAISSSTRMVVSGSTDGFDTWHLICTIVGRRTAKPDTRRRR